MSWVLEAKEYYWEYKSEGGFLNWKPFLKRMSAYQKQFPDRPNITEQKDTSLYGLYLLLKREAERNAREKTLEYWNNLTLEEQKEWMKEQPNLAQE